MAKKETKKTAKAAKKTTRKAAKKATKDPRVVTIEKAAAGALKGLSVKARKGGVTEAAHAIVFEGERRSKAVFHLLTGNSADAPVPTGAKKTVRDRRTKKHKQVDILANPDAGAGRVVLAIGLTVLGLRYDAPGVVW